MNSSTHLLGPQRSTSRVIQLPARQRFGPVTETVSDIYPEYDAAQTTHHNSRHWANADSLSADAANSVAVRQALRNRSRYEAQENNSYGKGIVLTLANDCIGTGPRLQVLTKNSSNNQKIETAFNRWSRLVNLACKLRTMRLAKCVDGGSFAQFVTNPRLNSPIQLDLFVIEADQISTPHPILGANAVDGIEFDQFGNPITYHLLKSHPGGNLFAMADKDDVDASDMIHMFRRDRAGQHRGIPEITPALPLFAQLRRFTLATIAAAETAADFAGVMYTDGPAIANPDDVEAMDAVELERNAMLTLPRGWKMGQMKAEHPGTTYEMFTKRILNEIARCLNMPFNVAAGNSAGYNFASGRLDHQTYFKSIEVERSEWGVMCLDRILSAWFDEAMLAGALPMNMGAMDELPHTWHWDGREHVDPKKTADAVNVRLGNGTTSYPAEFAAQGKDWEVEQQSQAAALGLSVDEYRGLLVSKLFSSTAPVEEEQEEEEEVLDDEEV